ncbi:protein of unknown function (plasmid) [Methylorubrum extorquens DM4]|jgi:nucleotide-binding universal stress UspA family protein|uniref:DUF2380 domain-containing protein n=2 Tax=Methylorubrum TaxID=2282523 RepID=C7CNA4_METED|nr:MULTISPECIES: DUF2380 domain-containing protein [Methylorubrum]CAX17134.1 protein of unknown function [Methylorubrum extorquens DM4]
MLQGSSFLPMIGRNTMARLDVLACMLPGKRLLPQISAIGLLLAALAPSPAGSAERRPIPLSVLPLKLLDTSNEPTDQSAQHAARLARMADSLAIDLTRSGLFQATAVSADHLLRSCPSGEAECLLRAAREEGAELIFVGVVHKSSTLILQLWARLVDARTGRDVLARDLNFRGDTDEAWQRAETFLVAQIRDAVALAR